MTPASCLYLGHVRHRRFSPVAHEFRYPLFLVYLDLGELDGVFRGRWLWSARGPAVAWFRREDHLGDPAVPLDRAVADVVEQKTGRRPLGPVRILTHLRYLGHCFNPVSFYFCHDSSGNRLEAIVAEVNNTPWAERHVYVLPADGPSSGGTMEFRNRKVLHVSPFLGMDYDYVWRVRPPGKQLVVHIENHGPEGLALDATLVLSRREISPASLAGVLTRYPFMTLQVVAGIHFEALRLWRKRVPFHPHPNRGAASAREGLP